MYHTITHSVRFGINPQALAMKQALLKREEALAYKADYQATKDRFRYIEGDVLINELLQTHFPKQAVSDALHDVFTEHIENIQYTQRDKTPQVYAKELLLKLREKIAGGPMPPPPNSPGSKAVRHLIEKYLKQSTINSKDMSHYRPVFHEQDEALFVQTLKEMIQSEESGNHRSHYDWVNHPRVHSVPLLIDIIDHAQTNPPNNAALKTPGDIEILAKPLVKMAKEGAMPYSLDRRQSDNLNKYQTTHALVAQLQKKGFLMEDGVKLLPDTLANTLCEILANPEGAEYASPSQTNEAQPAPHGNQVRLEDFY